LSDLRGPKKNIYVYAEMAENLREYGQDITPVEVKKKIESLKKRY